LLFSYVVGLMFPWTYC